MERPDEPRPEGPAKQPAEPQTSPPPEPPAPTPEPGAVAPPPEQPEAVVGPAEVPPVEPPPPPPPPPPPYPVRLTADPPPEQLSRLSTFFRLILMIPLLIMVGILGGTLAFSSPWLAFTAGGALSILLVAHWIAVVIRGRPVGWMFDTLVAIQRFAFRAQTYFMLVTDKYPPFEGEWTLHYEVDRPEKLSRWKVLIWKTLAIIPHAIVLAILAFAVAFCVVIAWFAILFTGRYPLAFRNFVIGWLRWYARVGAYWMSLRDEYPPFSLDQEVRPVSRGMHGLAAGSGFVLVAGAIGAIVAVIIALRTTETITADYEGLLAGQPTATLDTGALEFSLFGAVDPYTFNDPPILFAAQGTRFVAFGLEIYNDSVVEQEITEEGFSLKDTDGEDHDAVLVSLEGQRAPGDIEDESGLVVVAIFQIPEGEDPASVTYEMDFLTRAKFEFE